MLALDMEPVGGLRKKFRPAHALVVHALPILEARTTATPVKKAVSVRKMSPVTHTSVVKSWKGQT